VLKLCGKNITLTGIMCMLVVVLTVRWYIGMCVQNTLIALWVLVCYWCVIILRIISYIKFLILACMMCIVSWSMRRSCTTRKFEKKKNICIYVLVNEPDFSTATPVMVFISRVRLHYFVNLNFSSFRRISRIEKILPTVP
jgi:hypothetical protein